MKLYIIFTTIMGIIINIFMLWLFFAVVASSVKSISGNCADTYALDTYFYSTLFCVEKQKETLRGVK